VRVETAATEGAVALAGMAASGPTSTSACRLNWPAGSSSWRWPHNPEGLGAAASQARADSGVGRAQPQVELRMGRPRELGTRATAAWTVRQDARGGLRQYSSTSGMDGVQTVSRHRLPGIQLLARRSLRTPCGWSPPASRPSGPTRFDRVSAEVVAPDCDAANSASISASCQECQAQSRSNNLSPLPIWSIWKLEESDE